MHNGTSCLGSITTADYYNPGSSSTEFSEQRVRESSCSYQGRTLTPTSARADENTCISASESPMSKGNTSARAYQRIDGHLGKSFGILLRFINEESEQSDYVELYRLKLISLVDVLQKISAQRGEIPNSLFNVIRDLGIKFNLPDPFPEHLVTEEFCFSAVKANLKTFHYIPDKFKSQRLWRYILKQEPTYIEHVPANVFTEELLQFVLDNHLEAAEKLQRNVKVVRSELRKINDNVSVSGFIPAENMLLPVFPLIDYIPEQFKTQKICDLVKNHDKKSSMFFDSAIAYKSPESLTEEECLEACAIRGEELEYVPNKFKTQGVCLKAWEKFDNAHLHFPAEIFTEELGLRVLELKKGSLGRICIKTLIKKIKTESFCLACIKRNHFWFKHIPPELKTVPVYDFYFKMTTNLEGIPQCFIKDEYVKTVIKYKKEFSYFYIPDKHRNAEIDQVTMDLIHGHHYSYLSSFKHRPRESARLIRIIFDNASKDISYLDAKRIRMVLDLLSFNPSIATDDKKKIIDLVQIAILNTDRVNAGTEHLHFWVKSPVLTKEFKQKCLHCFHDFKVDPSKPITGSVQLSVPLNNGKQISIASDVVCHAQSLKEAASEASSTQANKTQITRERLINKSNPLQSDFLKNHSIPELTRLCENIELFSMPEQEAGDLFIESINQALKDSSFEPLEEHHYRKINGPSAYCDGRTLRVPTNEGVFHYKLQRADEDCEELARESAIHRYLANGKARELGLKSEIPVSQTLFKLSLDQLHCLHQLEAIAIHTDENNDNNNDNNDDGNKKRWVLGYCYRTDALNHYGTYAWKPNAKGLSNPADCFALAEQGLLTACFDMGRWCAMSIFFTSILPVYHDTGTDRRWAALHRPLGSSCEEDILCGTLGAWNSTATERTDLRYSGLADLVDYERFGDVTSYFYRYKDGQAFHRRPMTLQRLALANYLVEILLAAILIYARLHEDDPDYHIDSKTGKENLKLFIEKSALEFLKGLTRHQNSQTLAQVLGTSEGDCSCWLERTAEEILYWTAGIKSTLEGTVLNETVTNFANDLLRQGKLSSSLYSEHEFDYQNTEYPRCYHNQNGKLNLACNNKPFPLISLIQGLTKLSTNIICLLKDNVTDYNGGESSARTMIVSSGREFPTAEVPIEQFPIESTDTLKPAEQTSTG